MVCAIIAFRWGHSSTFVAEFQEDIQTVISVISEHLKDSDPEVRLAAIGILSGLAAQGMC